MAKGKNRRDGENKVKTMEYTTQRVDVETLLKIKTLNYHLLKSKKIRMSQADIIGWAILFASSREHTFLDFVESGVNPEESLFDTIVKATGKPWFPYGNLIDIK